MMGPARCLSGGSPLRIVLAISCALLLAGCFASDEPEAVGAASVDADAAVAGEPAADLAAGADANATPAAAPVLLPISFSGTTPQGTCHAFGCQWVTQGSEDFHPLEHAGRATMLHVEVAYADQEPGMEFYVGVCVGSGESENDVECGEYTTGPSPIVLHHPLDTTEQVALSLGSLSPAAAAAGAMLFGEASFDVTGTLTVVG